MVKMPDLSRGSAYYFLANQLYENFQRKNKHF